MTDIDIKTYTHSELRTLYDDPDWWRQKTCRSTKSTLEQCKLTRWLLESFPLKLMASNEGIPTGLRLRDGDGTF